MRECPLCYRKTQALVDPDNFSFFISNFLPYFPKTVQSFLVCKDVFIGLFLVTVHVIVSWLCLNTLFVLQHGSLPAAVILA